MKKATIYQFLKNTAFTLIIALGGLSSFATSNGDPVTGNSPVHLTSFNAKAARKVVDLQWSTNRELNANKFIIQRSTDGKAFVEISTIMNGDDSYASKTYNFTDERAIRNKVPVYYRLKIVDRDGQFSYSDVQVISREKMAELHF